MADEITPLDPNELANAEPGRYPMNENVNFSQVPVDFGLIHYASDTPYSRAYTLGARGMSYYGLDSTYASTLAILRRIFAREGIIAGNNDGDAGHGAPRTGTIAPV